MTDTAQTPLPAPQTPRRQSNWIVVSLRTIIALILREMSTRYGRSPGGYVWAILEPMGMIVILAYGFSLLMRTPALGTSFLLFYAAGFLPFNFFQTTSKLVGSALKFSRPLLSYPAVSWIDAVIGRFALNLLTSMLVFYILITGILTLTDARATISVGPILLSYALMGLLGLGIGMVNCVISGFIPVWDSVWSIITRPLFLASGVILIYEELPQFAQQVLWWNPLMHLTGMMRTGFYPMYQPEYISVEYVLMVGMPLLFFGLVFMQRYHKDILSKT
ncbi:ABC transporter permease [Roseisalinus antarcticus]|uniref:Transport permease protein n=1 Tax=Roseisalinus antarcticus TaxID=254357 RepID=A0A1Y5TPX1_9RHOB|nr:ABC transporter permease [Roseisalinus antarcticus]SLN68799.1 Polysialic acid transport protein KpsM [Roseisalinus antarcticus]